MPLERPPKSWRPRKWFYPLIVVLILLLVLGVLEATNTTHLLHQAPNPADNKARPTNSVDYSKGAPSDNTANDARKSSPKPAETLDNGPTASNTASPLGIVIVNAHRTGTDVRVGNIVNGTTAGTCTLTATQAGQVSPTPVTATVQQDVNYYDCGVMHMSLPDTGTWQLKLTVTSGSNSASATTNVEQS